MYKKWCSVYIVSLIIPSTVSLNMVTVSDYEEYIQARDKLLNNEQSTFFGKTLILTTREMEANKILLTKKGEELESAFSNSSSFLASAHFFRSKEMIEKSEVFSIIRKAPKGASLHTHSSAAVSVDFIINNITYRSNLYGCFIDEVFKLKFMTNPELDERCNWTKVKQMRENKTAPIFDAWLKKQFMLNVQDPEIAYPSLEIVWKQFKKVFSTTYDLLSYKPVFQDYTYQLLQELYDDNVFYTELKGVIFPLYDLNGTKYSKKQFFEIFIETVNNFKQNHPGFLGVRYIHSIYRGVNEETLREFLQELQELKKLFPDFIAGFDLVGFEEEGGPLLQHISELLQAQNILKFFFHAGETSWFGHTDLNLADAILLNSFRIGHGFALTKHPELLKMANERNIPVEICPISNQVLKLCDDPRNHPAAILMAMDYPVIIGNDDPSIWNATGLSFDWYIAFMAMTTKTSGIEVLKKFAINSITYSAMENEEKEYAMDNWKKLWDKFIDDILTKETEEEHAQT